MRVVRRSPSSLRSEGRRQPEEGRAKGLLYSFEKRGLKDGERSEIKQKVLAELGCKMPRVPISCHSHKPFLAAIFWEIGAELPRERAVAIPVYEAHWSLIKCILIIILADAEAG